MKNTKLALITLALATPVVLLGVWLLAIIMLPWDSSDLLTHDFTEYSVSSLVLAGVIVMVVAQIATYIAKVPMSIVRMLGIGLAAVLSFIPTVITIVDITKSSTSGVEIMNHLYKDEFVFAIALLIFLLFTGLALSTGPRAQKGVGTSLEDGEITIAENTSLRKD